MHRQRSPLDKYRNLARRLDENSESGVGSPSNRGLATLLDDSLCSREPAPDLGRLPNESAFSVASPCSPDMTLSAVDRLIARRDDASVLDRMKFERIMRSLDWADSADLADCELPDQGFALCYPYPGFGTMTRHDQGYRAVERYDQGFGMRGRQYQGPDEMGRFDQGFGVRGRHDQEFGVRGRHGQEFGVRGRHGQEFGVRGRHGQEFGALVRHEQGFGARDRRDQQGFGVLDRHDQGFGVRDLPDEGGFGAIDRRHQGFDVRDRHDRGGFGVNNRVDQRFGVTDRHDQGFGARYRRNPGVFDTMDRNDQEGFGARDRNDRREFGAMVGHELEFGAVDHHDQGFGARKRRDQRFGATIRQEQGFGARDRGDQGGFGVVDHLNRELDLLERDVQGFKVKEQRLNRGRDGEPLALDWHRDREHRENGEREHERGNCLLDRPDRHKNGRMRRHDRMESRKPHQALDRRHCERKTIGTGARAMEPPGRGVDALGRREPEKKSRHAASARRRAAGASREKPAGQGRGGGGGGGYEGFGHLPANRANQTRLRNGRRF